MNRTCLSLIAALSISTSALADVPVYRDKSLVIDQALVVTESSTIYYKDVRLTANPDGSFKLVQAVRLEPVHVDEVLVLVEEPPVEVSVEISGYLPNPCFDLEEAAVAREGSTFTIVLAQRELQTFAACAQVIQPFTVRVPLKVSGLSAGHYTVFVNGQESGFDLDTDAP